MTASLTKSSSMRITMPEIPRMCTARKMKSISFSPIIENGPISAEKAIIEYSSFLMPYEIKEIKEYKEIYFLGYPTYKNRSKSDFFEKMHIKDHIMYRYEILKLLGSGSYGKVIEVYDHKTKQNIAIKVLKYSHLIKRETSALVLLSKHKCPNTIQGLSYFLFRSHGCISFELLNDNLHQIQIKNKFQPMKEDLVKEYALQILQSLKEYSKLGLIHCDLKPSNICLTSENQSKIKIIDFGTSYRKIEDKGSKSFYIQSRFYRAPEVILHLDYGPEIDVWSTALIIIELLIGRPAFPGRNELEMLNLMVELLGSVPFAMIKSSPRKKIFFNDDNSLKPFNGIKSKKKISIRNLLGNESSYYLVDFLKKCLTWKPELRLNAAQALQHPWFKKESLSISISSHSDLPCLKK